MAPEEQDDPLSTAALQRDPLAYAAALRAVLTPVQAASLAALIRGGGAAVAEAPVPGRAPAPRKPATPKFKPSLADVPADLQCVKEEILGFWEVKKGTRNQAAWEILLRQLRLIRDDYRGGTEVMRSQLESAISAGWMSVTHANWLKFGLPFEEERDEDLTGRPLYPPGC